MSIVKKSLRPRGPQARRELVKDPVCGMVKPKEKMRADYIFMGKAYYFCTEGDKQSLANCVGKQSLALLAHCKKMFEAHPEHWLPRKVSLEK